jgi:TonB family protein
MFTGLQGDSSKTRLTRSGSLLFHLALLAWLVHAPAPTFLAPRALRKGLPTGSVTQLYWPKQIDQTGHDGDTRADSRPHKETAGKSLVYAAAQEKKKKGDQAHVSKHPDDSQIAGATQAGSAAPAGSPRGSTSNGELDGFEIRPALWASGSDPVVSVSDLGGKTEGNVIVEVTIDEHGNVVLTRLLQGLAPVVDAKVVAALESWRFHPATRDGIPVASKQDVYYHFPRS